LQKIMQPPSESYRQKSNQPYLDPASAHTPEPNSSRPYSLPYNVDTSPKSGGAYSSRDRNPSPATSFLENIGLGASPDDRPKLSRFAGTDGNNHGQEHHEAYNGDEGYRGRHSGESRASNTLKRSAVSPAEEPQQQEANKRHRQENHSVHPGAQSIPRRCADAATQTEVPDTASAKLALLREEEAAAKVKHGAEMAMAQARYEAEVARRRQVMAEVEFESKMLALHQLSEASSSKKSATPAPILTGSASTGTYDSLRLQSSTSRNVADAPSTAKEQVQSVGSKPKVQEALKSLVSSTRQQHKEEKPAANHHNAGESPSAPIRLPEASSNVSSPVKRTTAPDTSKAAAKASSPLSERPKSSKSHSVHMKRTRSPIAEAPSRPQADTAWMPNPGLKHLTCYFWKHTGCSKSAAECNYAHFDTGVTATDPERLRRYKRR
ncbi:MAG: hypothetical protein Q9171_007495, partial [Xanthocarpia ochracea]